MEYPKFCTGCFSKDVGSWDANPADGYYYKYIDGELVVLGVCYKCYKIQTFIDANKISPLEPIGVIWYDSKEHIEQLKKNYKINQ